jgi:hypothetical protein
MKRDALVAEAAADSRAWCNALSRLKSCLERIVSNCEEDSALFTVHEFTVNTYMVAKLSSMQLALHS